MAKRSHPGTDHSTSPFVEILRSDWATLAKGMKQPLTELELVQLRGLGDQLDLAEVQEVYLPLSKLISLYVTEKRELHRKTAEFLGERARPTTFVIGVAGSVAVGKSTTARLLRELLRRWDTTPRVELVTTDGFLFPNAELERRGLMDRKGFPESYDRRALLRFVSEVKSGASKSRAPFYSHLNYDVVPNAEIIVNQPDVLILEGLNVLQPSPSGKSLAISDLFDFSIYVDAKTEDIEEWFMQRFQKLKTGAFADPKSFFHRFTEMSSTEATDFASSVWKTINLTNLEENIKPTRARANLVLRKDSSHSVEKVLLRKL